MKGSPRVASRSAEQSPPIRPCQSQNATPMSAATRRCTSRTTASDGGGARRDYLRARLERGRLTPLIGQDSGRTMPLASANALLIRDIGAPARDAGAMADYIVIA